MTTAKYQPWYKRFPERFRREKEAMAARGFLLIEEALRQDEVAFRGKSTVDPSRTLLVIYPGGFPSGHPLVYNPLPAPLLRRHHRPETREICLFGVGQGRWTAKLLGTSAIDEAEEVIREFGPGAAPSPDDTIPEPVSVSYTYEPETAVLVAPGVASLAAPTTSGRQGTFHIRFNPQAAGKDGGRGVIVRASLDGQVVDDVPPLPAPWQKGQVKPGTLVYLSSPPPYIESAREFDAWLRQERLVSPHGHIKTGWWAFVFPEQSGSSTHYRLAWLVARITSDRKVHFLRTFTLRQDEREARVPGTAELASKTVVIVGCGSLGSKIAMALAATGVGKFVLVDSELFEPGNAIRHEAGMESVGMHKVDALEMRLSSAYPRPGSHVEKLMMRVGGRNAPSSEQKLFDLVTSADLVINATWSHQASRYLNDLCCDFGIPSIHASVTDGAWGGEIVRVIPCESGCWLCWLHQYEDERPPSEPTPVTGIFAPGCGHPTFSGATYELGMVANLAAWAAIETLLRGVTGRYDMPDNYIRWSGRDVNGIPRATTEFLPVRSQQGCPFCRPA